jgi:hypothetical protein
MIEQDARFFTRRNHRVVAHLLCKMMPDRATREFAFWSQLVREFAAAFGEDNSGFNRSTFYRDQVAK